MFLCKASTVLVEGMPEEYQSDEKAGMDQIIPGRDLLAVKGGEVVHTRCPRSDSRRWDVSRKSLLKENGLSAAHCSP